MALRHLLIWNLWTFWSGTSGFKTFSHLLSYSRKTWGLKNFNLSSPNWRKEVADCFFPKFFRKIHQAPNLPITFQYDYISFQTFMLQQSLPESVCLTARQQDLSALTSCGATLLLTLFLLWMLTCSACFLLTSARGKSSWLISETPVPNTCLGKRAHPIKDYWTDETVSMNPHNPYPTSRCIQ